LNERRRPREKKSLRNGPEEDDAASTKRGDPEKENETPLVVIEISQHKKE